MASRFLIAIAAISGMSTSAVLAASDPLVAAVTFALTGSDVGEVTVVNRADCIFDVHSVWGERKNTARFFLNVIDPIRITANAYHNQIGQNWIMMSIAGEGVVLERSSLLPGQSFVEPTRFSHETIRLETSELNRLTRAWQYIYSHGCTGKRSAF